MPTVIDDECVAVLVPADRMPPELRIRILGMLAVQPDDTEVGPIS
jgi:hypothetical protein